MLNEGVNKSLCTNEKIGGEKDVKYTTIQEASRI